MKYTIDNHLGCMLRENMIVRCLFVGVCTQRARIRSRAAKHRLDEPAWLDLGVVAFLQSLQCSDHCNVATAHKLVRISWAGLSSGKDYRPILSQQFAVPARRSDLEFVSQKSADEKEERKHSQTACPRTCVKIQSGMQG